MDCEQSLPLLSDFLSGSLDEAQRAWVRTHLAECLECLGVFRDLEIIVHVTVTLRAYEDIPFPNEDALWQRIEVAKREGV